MKLNKKGTEKPIEIFVALFIILAVAMLMLRVFTNQLTDQEQELANLARESEVQQLRQSAIQHCNQRCTEAATDRCSLRSMARLCLSYGSDAIKDPNWLDLNFDGELGVDTTLLVGVAVCEDEVPCHALISTCCGKSLSPNDCKTILHNYWDSQGFTNDQKEDLFASQVRKGTCSVDSDITTWWADWGIN